MDNKIDILDFEYLQPTAKRRDKDGRGRISCNSSAWPKTISCTHEIWIQLGPILPGHLCP